MMSVGLQRAYNKAKKYNETLRADDLRLANAVKIIHEDGTFYFFDSAFMMEVIDDEYERYHKKFKWKKWKKLGYSLEVAKWLFKRDKIEEKEKGGKYIAVFSEHNDFHVFAKHDLSHYSQYTRNYSDVERL